MHVVFVNSLRPPHLKVSIADHPLATGYSTVQYNTLQYSTVSGNCYSFVTRSEFVLTVYYHH